MIHILSFSESTIKISLFLHVLNMTIAYWCVLVAILLPYVWFAIANKQAKKPRNNEEPRDFLITVEGMARRAFGAHLNSFEANIGFIAGVIIASLVHAPQMRIDILAIIYVIVRVLHGYFYITGKGTLRSIMFGIGFVATIGFFVISM